MDSRWFEEARFGMFIHWGLYSLPAGRWKGKTVPWVAEWIMNKFAIPVKEYEGLAAKFNPVKFDAEEWCRYAKDAGMKYIVFTAKHHEGFAMFKSTWSTYNIVDATPFGRDVLAELAEACRKYGLRLGCYYSQDQDWHEEGATGNDWDFPTQTPEGFQAYFNGKVKHQLREILTNYGDIALIWCDTPAAITPEQSRSLKEFIHSLQPDCLVNGRIGNDMGDYVTLGDNAMPNTVFSVPAEGIATMNDSWGYKADDHNWRTPESLFRRLGAMVNHNANFLLNVGPKGDGSFPAQAKAILRKIGSYVSFASPAIYGSGHIGFSSPAGYPWGEVSANKKHAWLWVFNPQKDMVLFGIRNKAVSVTDLQTGKPLPFREQHDSAWDYHKLTIDSSSLKHFPTVLDVALDGTLDVHPHPYYAAHDRWTEEKKI